MNDITQCQLNSSISLIIPKIRTLLGTDKEIQLLVRFYLEYIILCRYLCFHGGSKQLSMWWAFLSIGLESIRIYISIFMYFFCVQDIIVLVYNRRKIITVQEKSTFIKKKQKKTYYWIGNLKKKKLFQTFFEKKEERKELSSRSREELTFFCSLFIFYLQLYFSEPLLLIFLLLDLQEHYDICKHVYNKKCMFLDYCKVLIKKKRKKKAFHVFAYNSTQGTVREQT